MVLIGQELVLLFNVPIKNNKLLHAKFFFYKGDKSFIQLFLYILLSAIYYYLISIVLIIATLYSFINNNNTRFSDLKKAIYNLWNLLISNFRYINNEIYINLLNYY